MPPKLILDNLSLIPPKLILDNLSLIPPKLILDNLSLILLISKFLILSMTFSLIFSSNPCSAAKSWSLSLRPIAFWPISLFFIRCIVLEFIKPWNILFIEPIPGVPPSPPCPPNSPSPPIPKPNVPNIAILLSIDSRTDTAFHMPSCSVPWTLNFFILSCLASARDCCFSFCSCSGVFAPNNHSLIWVKKLLDSCFSSLSVDTVSWFESSCFSSLAVDTLSWVEPVTPSFKLFSINGVAVVVRMDTLGPPPLP